VDCVHTFLELGLDILRLVFFFLLLLFFLLLVSAIVSTLLGVTIIFAITSFLLLFTA